MILALFKRFLAHRGGVALIEFAIVFPVFFLLLFGGIEITRLILIQQKLEKAGYVIADIVTRYKPATLAAAGGEISVAELNTNVFPQLARMMGTYSEPARQVAILTSLRVSGPTAGRTITIDWQIGGGGNMNNGACDGLSPNTCATSIVNNLAPLVISNAVRGGGPGCPACIGTIGAFLPASTANAPLRTLILGLPEQIGATDYTVMVNEVFYFYQPLLGTLVEDVGTAGGSGFAGYRFFLRPKIFAKRTFFVPRLEGKLFDLPPTFPVP
jgi:TadE-like protein